MKSVEEHAADVTSLLGPGPVETVALADAAGRVLRTDVRSRWSLPRFTCSAVDGFAVRADDVAACPARLRVVGEIHAGDPAAVAVGPGTAVRLMTGGPVPPGADAVVMIEHTDGGRDGQVTVTRPVAPGAAVRLAGDDVGEGAVVLAGGRRLGAAQLGAAAAAGAHELTVAGHPRVVVVTTGDELVPAGTEPGPAGLVDSNGPALTAALTDAGAQVVATRHARDDDATFLSLLDGLGPVDLVVTAGGISMGDRDVVKSALRPLGVRFDRVAMQPGMPQAWGRWREGGPALVGLPGNPVSVLVSFELFVRPLLKSFLGETSSAATVRAVLGADVRSPAGRRQFVRVRFRLDGNGFWADPVSGDQGSHLLVGLAAADGLAVVGEDTTLATAGTAVDVLPLPGWAP